MAAKALSRLKTHGYIDAQNFLTKIDALDNYDLGLLAIAFDYATKKISLTHMQTSKAFVTGICHNNGNVKINFNEKPEGLKFISSGLSFNL